MLDSFVSPWTKALQAPLFMGFLRQERMGCHFLLQGIFLIQGFNLYLLHCRQNLYHLATWEAHICMHIYICVHTHTHTLIYVKKAESRRIDAFELWCWRRLLRVSWTARRCNQSILKEISPGISLEGMTLKLKLQYFGHLMWRVDSLQKTLILGGIGGRKRRGQQRTRWLDGIIDSIDVSLSELRELVIDREAWRAVIHGITKSRTGLSDWSDLMINIGLPWWLRW